MRAEHCETVGPWPSAASIEDFLNAYHGRWGLECAFRDDRQARYRGLLKRVTITVYRTTMNMHIQASQRALAVAQAHLAGLAAAPPLLALCDEPPEPGAAAEALPGENVAAPAFMPWPGAREPLAAGDADAMLVDGPLWLAAPGPASTAPGVESVGPWPSEAAVVAFLAAREVDWSLTRAHTTSHRARFEANDPYVATLTICARTLHIHVQGRHSFEVLNFLRAGLAEARARP